MVAARAVARLLASGGNLPSDENVEHGGTPVSLLLSVAAATAAVAGCGIGGVRIEESSLAPADLRTRSHALPAGSSSSSVRRCASSRMRGAMKDLTADF